MKHLNGDCPKADPDSDALCELCHKCREENCVRTIGHTGFHWGKKDLPHPNEDCDCEEEHNPLIEGHHFPPETTLKYFKVTLNDLKDPLEKLKATLFTWSNPYDRQYLYPKLEQIIAQVHYNATKVEFHNGNGLINLADNMMMHLLARYSEDRPIPPAVLREEWDKFIQSAIKPPISSSTEKG